jgi:hypothetical protein
MEVSSFLYTVTIDLKKKLRNREVKADTIKMVHETSKMIAAKVPVKIALENLVLQLY